MLWLLVVLASSVSSHNILCLFPHHGASHWQVYNPLLRSLSERNHHITVIGHNPLQNPPKNYKDIVLPKKVRPVPLNLQQLGSKTKNFFIIFLLEQWARDSCHKDFNSDVVRDFLKTNETFDLIITQAFNSECFRSFINKFPVPVIVISTCFFPNWFDKFIGLPTHPAYIPNVYQEASDQMSFFERVVATVADVFQSWYYHNKIVPLGEETAREYFGEKTISFKEMGLNTSLFLINTHFSLNLPRPVVPALIEIGGIHIGQVKSLPANLEKWINESSHGVIYFSLGSMIKGHTFPEEKRREFLKAFGRLPQRVLWKYENDTMPEKPDNVMIQKWMPQLDILCHPNVKAFISHGGLLGTTEAVHCGVPMIVMPQFGDQFTNAKAVEATGGGVILHLHEATEEKVYNSLTTILDPAFKKQTEELSARFKDRPLPPLETAIYWVEYVARHKGAHHMRTAAVGMPLYKYLLLDVIGFLLLVFAAISYICFYITRAIFRKLFGRRPKRKTN